MLESLLFVFITHFSVFALGVITLSVLYYSHLCDLKFPFSPYQEFLAQMETTENRIAPPQSYFGSIRYAMHYLEWQLYISS